MNTYATRQLILIDPSVPDAAQLLQDLPADNNAVMLTAHTDQITQISTLLKQYQKLEALHLVTHGSPGALHFSNAALSGSTLNQYWDQLAGWSASMTDDAEILLYGCETAQGKRGQQFLNELSVALQRGVAASTTKVGHAALGGRWELQRFDQDKNIPAAVFASDTVQSNWAFTLTVADENYEGDPTGPTTSHDGWTYTSNDTGASNLLIGPTLDLTGQSYSFQASAQNAQTEVSIKTTDGSEFKLNSFDIGRGFGTFDNLVIKGFKDNSEVATSTPSTSGDTHHFDVSANADW